MSIKLETDAIRTIALFESMTKVHAKDCLITDNCIYFLVEQSKIGLAIGKGGMVIKNVKRALNKNVKIFGYADTPEGMIKGMIPEPRSITLNDGSMVVSISPQDRVNVIGRNGENIKAIREIMKRHFSIENLRLRM
ncbi:MAG: NusA-like transcription termination signal-binding factor [Candidatus Aenigmarchaeota archaeon]